MNKLLGKIGEELLWILQDLGELSYDIVTTPYGKLRINSIPRSTYYSSIKNLEEQKLITKRKVNYKNTYILTSKGHSLLTKKNKTQKRNDGYATIIIFDVPEDKAKQRTMFRRYLSKNGYTLLQKSVLISPNKITNDIKEVINELNLRSYVTVISGKVDYTF
ncbi:MAG: CRISPR-associated endonuclease Cas2 [bacterium]|nr:CRISPR-associated endonuclease Cas2 [bacterium]